MRVMSDIVEDKRHDVFYLVEYQDLLLSCQDYLHLLPGFPLVLCHHLPAGSARTCREAAQFSVLRSRYCYGLHRRIRIPGACIEHGCPFGAESGDIFAFTVSDIQFFYFHGALGPNAGRMPDRPLSWKGIMACGYSKYRKYECHSHYYCTENFTNDGIPKK